MDDRKLSEEISNALKVVYQMKLNSDEQDALMTDTLEKWKNHVNDGFLKYRKSVSNESMYALLDWNDPFPGTSWFCDQRGRRYLDLLGGYGIYNVGRRHPDVLRAVTAQLQKQALHSQELLDPLRAQCAYVMSLLMPPGLKNFFFTNSGTESVEACLKMAMLATGRNTVIAFVNGFHGKTLGSLSCTAKAAFRAPFLKGLNKTLHGPLNHLEWLSSTFQNADSTGEKIAAVLLEPIQGEGGIHLATDEFMRHARALCDAHGAMLIFDEVQSGMGRTGKWWACQHSGVTPDLMAIGKAFGGGVVPAGACVGTDRVWEKYREEPFLFTTTFGGNPLAMAAAIATVDVIHRCQLVDRAAVHGVYFKKCLEEVRQRHPDTVKEIRGRGLMMGIEFYHNEDGIEFSKRMLDKGVLMAGTLSYAKTIRIEPSLTVTREDIDFAVKTMEKAIYEIEVPSTKRLRAKL